MKHPVTEGERSAAEKYVRDCLEIMDGSAEAGIRRIGTERFEQTVQDVLKVTRRRDGGGK